MMLVLGSQEALVVFGLGLRHGIVAFGKVCVKEQGISDAVNRILISERKYMVSDNTVE